MPEKKDSWLRATELLTDAVTSLRCALVCHPFQKEAHETAALRADADAREMIARLKAGDWHTANMGNVESIGARERRLYAETRTKL